MKANTSSGESEVRRDATQTHFVPVPWKLQDEAASDIEIDALCIAVYAAIKRFCDFGGETGAAVSDEKVAKLAGCSPRTLRNRRERLREAGWLDWQRKPGAVNRYTVRDQPRHDTPRIAAGAAEDRGESCRGGGGQTAARAAEGSAGDAAVPRRELPTTESHAESHSEREAGSSSLRSSDPEPRAAREGDSPISGSDTEAPDEDETTNAVPTGAPRGEGNAPRRLACGREGCDFEAASFVALLKHQDETHDGRKVPTTGRAT